MKTVSLEMAKKLKETGLKWEPKEGDWYHIVFEEDIYPEPLLFCSECNCLSDPETYIWLPTLSDLLEWLENKGYLPDVVCNIVNYGCILWTNNGKDHPKCVGNFHGDTWEDAVAKAVLWLSGSDNK